jgi:hypothetical protein
MAVQNQDRVGRGDAVPDDLFPRDDPSPVNPAEAVAGSSALSNDDSDAAVLTPGEYAYQPVEVRRPDGADREYERPGAEAGPGRGGEMSTDTSRTAARELPIADYHSLTIPEIIQRIPTLSSEELREIQEYERSHRRRKTLLVRIERQLRNTT